MAQEESALLEEVQGGMRGAAERMSQSASAAAARKLCQMGMIRGAVAEDREGSRPEALPARWRSVSALEMVRGLGTTLNPCRGDWTLMEVLTMEKAMASWRALRMGLREEEGWRGGRSGRAARDARMGAILELRER